MQSISEHVDRIRAVSESVGAAELARQAGLPYTTVVDWKAREYRPRSIEIFEQLSIAAMSLDVTDSEAPEGVISSPCPDARLTSTDKAAEKIGQPVGEPLTGGAA